LEFGCSGVEVSGLILTACDLGLGVGLESNVAATGFVSVQALKFRDWGFGVVSNRDAGPSNH